MIRDCLVLLTWLCTVQGDVGYFWHITDIHYDPMYSAQGSTTSKCSNKRSNANNAHSRLDRRTLGMYGDYGCDSPWALVESAAQAMKAKSGDGIEFILWTGDALTHTASMSDELRLQYLKNLTDLLAHTFKSQFIFPALGHEDVGLNLTQIANLWKLWLPSEALQTFTKTGYYTIEQRSKNYRIILLNTNLWMYTEAIVDNRVSQRKTGSSADHPDDPHGQWTWFRNELNIARGKKQSVYIVGHTPPGVDERESGAKTLYEKHNKKYLQLVRQYADIIRGQFFGHWHSDTFRVIYSDSGSPVSWMMMAPSITPNSPGGPNNPGLRLYKFDVDTGQVLDYTQFFLNLPHANSEGQANWATEYSLLEQYKLKEITPLSLHSLADRFTQSNDNAFVRYYAANTVSLPREVDGVWGCGGPLSGTCALHHYCAVTRVNPSAFRDCIASYAYALASVGSPTTHAHPVLCLLSTCVSLMLLRLPALRNR